MTSHHKRPLHPAHDGIDYELVISETGTATLTCGGDVMWVSDSDDEYSEEMDDEFIDFHDEDQVDEVLNWLESKGYLPPEVDVDVVREEDALYGSES